MTLPRGDILGDKKIGFQNLRVGTEVKGTYRSCRGPGFGSQHPHRSPRLPETPTLRIPCSPLTVMGFDMHVINI